MGEGGGGVQPPPNEVHDAIMYRIMQYTREESRWMEERIEKKMEAGQERMETQLKELKAGQEAQYKDIKAGQEKMWERMEAQAKDTKAGQEKMREGLEKKMEAGQERIDALFRDLITGQEKMEERLEKKMEAQAKDSKAGQEKMEVVEKLGIGAIAFLSAQQGGLFSSLWALIKPLLP